MTLRSWVPEKGTLHCDRCGEPYGTPRTTAEEKLIRLVHGLFLKKAEDEHERIRNYAEGTELKEYEKRKRIFDNTSRRRRSLLGMKEPEAPEVPDGVTAEGRRLAKQVVTGSDRVYAQVVQMDVNGHRADGTVSVKITVKRPDVSGFSLRMANRWHETLNRHCHWVAMDLVNTFNEILKRSSWVKGSVELADECPLPAEIQADLDERNAEVVKQLNNELEMKK